MSEVVIIDYGMGNLYSVSRAIEVVGGKPVISDDPSHILSSEKLILPGVGAFGKAMRELETRALIEPIKESVKNGKPFMGICLGMQLMMDESEEFGVHKGLGIIPGVVKEIPKKSKNGVLHKIPNIGWCPLVQSNTDKKWENTIFKYTTNGESMYFLHSYSVHPEDNDDRLADIFYGGHRLSAAIGRDNIVGCQFHPERSGKAGLNLLQEFIKQV